MRAALYIFFVFLSAVATAQKVDDVNIRFGTTTRGDANVARHGFLPKLSGDSMEYLNGLGEWNIPPYPFVDTTFWQGKTGPYGEVDIVNTNAGGVEISGNSFVNDTILLNDGESTDLSDPIRFVYGYSAKIIHTSMEDFDTTIIIGNSGNNVSIDQTNAIRLNGNSTVWEDLRIDGQNVGGGAKEPSLTDNFLGISGLKQRMWQGSAQDDEVFFNVQLPHQWKQGGGLELHLHNCPWTTPGAADSVCWEFSYAWQNINGTYSTLTTDTTVQRLNGTAQWQHRLIELVNLTSVSSAKTLSSILVCWLRRLAHSSARDTYTAGMSVLYIDLHYEIDALGSKQEVIK